MNIIKVVLIGLSGLGLGFTTKDLLSDDIEPSNGHYETIVEEGSFRCHHGYYGDGFDYFIERFSEVDQQRIEEYLDALLTEYGVTRETFETDYEIRHEVMFELHQFIDDEQIEYDETDWHHSHMGGWSR